MGAIGRQCSVVNLDPANDHTNYPCALDIRNLVTLEEIMADDQLGPNGGVLYALEELEQNMQWLEEGLKELGEDYILFDCPGQVELYTHHNSLRNIFYRLQKLGYRVRMMRLWCGWIHSTNLLSASSGASIRQLLPYTTFALYFQHPTCPEGNAPDGSPSHQCSDQDRQDLVIRPTPVQPRLLYRRTGPRVPSARAGRGVAGSPE